MRKILIAIILLTVFKIEAQPSVLSVADSLYAYGNYTKAIQIYKTHNNPSEVYDKIAKAYLAIGNDGEALLNYNLSLKANPDNALVKYDYAKLLSRHQKLEEASVLLKELLNIDTKNPNYHYELGLVLELQSDTLAINSFKNAFDLDSTHQKAIYKIAEDYLVNRKHNLSLKYIDTGLRAYENNIELINLKALNYYWDEKYVEAAKWFEKEIELGQSSQFIHEKLSFCYAQDSEYKKAIEQGEIALQYDPKNKTNLYIQGQLYERIGDFKNAEKYISAALELMDIPLDAEYSKLAVIYNSQNKYKEAIDAIQIAINENPKNQFTQFLLVLTKDKYYADIDSKIKVYEDFKEKFPNNIYVSFVDKRLKELKEEKFMKGE